MPRSARAPAGLPPRPAASAALASWLPFLVAFLFVPVSLYFPNQQDLSGDLGILAPYPAVALAAFGLLYLRYRRVAPAPRTVVVLLGLGLFLLFSDLVAPLQIGEFRDGVLESPVPEPLSLTLREIALAAAVALAARLAPREALLRYAPPFVLILALVQAGHLGGELARVARRGDVSGTPLAPPPGDPRPGGNVYLITLDGFSSWGFERLIRESGYAEDFEGFVFFEENRSNYLYTWISRASYMSGTLFRDGSVGDWMNAWLRGGLIADLRGAGFEVWQYINAPFRHRDASHLTTDAGGASGAGRAAALHFADLWLLRLAPTFLAQETYRPATRGVFTGLLRPGRAPVAHGDLPERHVDLMRRVIADEAGRPATGQFVHAHIYLPHPPYILDRECRPVPGGTNRREQSLCALRLMDEFVRELKRRGAYDDATIVLHADHGRSEHGPADPLAENVDPATFAQMKQREVEGGGAQVLLRRSRSLLLVKPPRHARGPLAVSRRIVQLADIPATITGLAGVGAGPGDGRSVFAPDLPEDREVDVFAGFTRLAPGHRWERFGTDFFSGEFNHFTYGRGGWKILPNLPVRW